MLLADSLIFTRDLVVPGDRDAAYRKVRCGALAIVTPGVLVDAESWAAALPEERHRTLIRAIAALRPRMVFGGLSAALLWHRPLIGPAPAKPIVIADLAAGGRSDRSVAVAATSAPFDVDVVDGIRVTSLARSVVDAARRNPFAVSVALFDHALASPRWGEGWSASARTTREELADELIRGTHVGRSRAARAYEFADGASGSPGESLSRVLIAEGGFAAPVLQREFFDRMGLIGYTDFCWPDARVIGEFDGYGKYLREELTQGRSVAEVVMAEKRREDRLRALGFQMVRWEWPDLQQPTRLFAKLRDANIPVLR